MWRMVWRYLGLQMASFVMASPDSLFRLLNLQLMLLATKSYLQTSEEVGFIYQDMNAHVDIDPSTCIYTA